jgi:hypothetical protein
MRLAAVIGIVAVVWGCSRAPDDLGRMTTSTKLDCANPLVTQIDYVMSPVGRPKDAVAAARDQLGTTLRADDRIAIAAGTQPPVAIVMRGGRPVARVTLARAEDGGLYASEVAACRGEGFLDA